MDAVITKLVEQAPTSVALIVVVVFFINYLEKRDKAITAALDKITERLQSLEGNQIKHNTSMVAAVSEMRGAIQKRSRRERQDATNP